MPNIQGTYDTGYAPGYPGMIANGETSNRVSRIVEGAAGLAFGRAAFRGAGVRSATATPAAGKAIGIAIGNYAPTPKTDGSTADLYPEKSTAAILTQGVVWVVAGEAVAEGDQAYAASSGAINKTAAGNTILPGWFFDGAAASGALVRLAKR